MRDLRDQLAQALVLAEAGEPGRAAVILQRAADRLNDEARCNDDGAKAQVEERGK